jgi:hypothetical protein
MTKLTFGAAAIAVAVSWAATASADPMADAAQADASFNAGMQLRSAGQWSAACPKFAESQRLAPAVGVTLYLAECYEKTGRNASAWREYRSAEKLARARNDKRADVAAEHAAALEPGLSRLTVAPPDAAAKAGGQVQLDGAAVPAEYWNAAMAVDPGDHVVTFASPGQPVRTFTAHVDAGNPSTVVRIDDAPGAGAAAPVAAVAALPATPVEPSPIGSADAGARWGAVALMVAGAAGIGVGTWFITSKTRDMENGQLCEPHLHPGAVPAAAIAFSAGGLALVSGITIFYIHRPGRAEVAVSTMATPGGAGAVLRAAF